MVCSGAIVTEKTHYRSFVHYSADYHAMAAYQLGLSEPKIDAETKEIAFEVLSKT